jgi:hypothetical protein
VDYEIIPKCNWFCAPGMNAPERRGCPWFWP